MKTVQIIYYCIGKYSVFAENFIQSLEHFMPGPAKKLTIISDGLQEYHNTDKYPFISKIEVVQTPKLPYAFLLMNKFAMYRKHIDSWADYVFYFDADSICRQRENTDWISFFDLLESGRLLFSYNPHFISKDYHHYLFKDDKIDYYNVNHIFPPDYKEIITSFWGGARVQFERFCDYIINILERTYSVSSYADINGWHIPRFCEEVFVNAALIHNMYTDDYFCGNFDVSFKHFVGFMDNNIMICDGYKVPDDCVVFQKNFVWPEEKHNLVFK